MRFFFSPIRSFFAVVILVLLCSPATNAQWYKQISGLSVSPGIDAYINTTGVSYNQVRDTLKTLVSVTDSTEGGLATKLRVQDLFWSGRVNANDTSGHNMFDQYHKALRAVVLAGRGGCGPDAAKWECVGPDNLPWQAMGYVRCVWADTGTDSNFVLAGSERGGLFRTTDGGANWENITDNAPITSGVVGIESICVNPHNKNTIYLGTEYAGILKSFDRGATWQQEFIGYGGYGDSIRGIQFVYMRPDSLRLYAFCRDSVYTRSNAAGASHAWQNITPAGNCSGTIWCDLEFVPGDQNSFFISNKQGADLYYQGIYRSTDSIPAPGDWVEITAGFEDYVGGSLKHETDWHMMKMSMPDSDTLFFLAYSDTKNANIYKFSLSGNTFAKVHDNVPFEYLEYVNGKGELIVTPINSANDNYRNIYFAWDKPYQSWDGGATFHAIGAYSANTVTPTHGDVRCLYLQKVTNTWHGVNDRLFVATDGGVSKKPSGWDASAYGATATKDISGRGLNCGEFIGFSTSEAGGKGIGGSMHNGIFAYEPAQMPKWRNFGVNDSWNATFDRSNYDTAYVWDEIHVTKFQKVYPNPATGRELDIMTSVSPLPIDEHGFFLYPILANDNFGNGYSVQHRFWRKTPLLAFDVDPSFGFPNPSTFTGTPRAKDIAIDPSSIYFNGYILYDDSKIYYRHPPTLASETSPVPAASVYPVVGITTDPNNTERVWVTKGGVNYNDYLTTRHRVFYSPDHGTNWIDVSKGLPQRIPPSKIVYDEVANALYCATDAGIYRCNFNAYNSSASATEGGIVYNTSVEWECFNNGKVTGKNFPNAWVSALCINRCEGKLYASTYGRSLWATPLPVIPTDEQHHTEITTNTTWSSEKFMQGSIKVKAGAVLTILGTTIHMPANSLIMVEPGAKLVVNSSTLTNSCEGCFWNGIEAWGNSSLVQNAANQGWVEIKNNSIIEHARVGVKNYMPATTSSVFDAGGVIQARGSTFRNNIISVDFAEYHSPGGSYSSPYLPNISWFNDCTFLTNNNFRGVDLTTPPICHVNLSGVEGINFRACHFLNRNTSFYRGMGIGINSVNSGYNVVPYCAVASTSGCLTSPSRCRFAGLTKGVFARQAGSWYAQALSIDQADFDSVSIGVNISVQRTVTVTRCAFKIGRGIVAPFVEGYSGLPSSGCGRNIGILTQNSFVFGIEQNTFTGQSNSFGISPWYNTGVLAVNSGNYSNRIFKNSFSTLKYGVHGLKNGIVHADPNPPLLGHGLQVSCNTFANNGYDIYSSGGIPGIGTPQSGTTTYSDAANTFSGSTKNLVNLSPTLSIDYRLSTTPLISYSGLVTLSYTSLSDGCNSTIPTGGGSPSFMTAAPTSLNAADLSAYKAAFYAARYDFDAAKANYDLTIDAGNTDSVLYVIDTTTDTNALLTALSGMAPFLSAAVLTKAAAAAGEDFYQDILDLLDLHPEVIRDYALLSKIADTIDMGGQDFDDLWAAAGLSTQRTVLDDAIRGAKMSMDENAKIVLTALKSPRDTNVSVYDTTFAGVCLDSTSIFYLVDTNSVYHSLDSVDQWLQNIGSLTATYDRIGLKLFAKNYTGAVTLFNSISTSGMNADELEEYHLFDTVLHAQYIAGMDGRSVMQLTAGEIAALHPTDFDDVAQKNTIRLTVNNLTQPISNFPCVAPLPGSKPIRNERHIKQKNGLNKQMKVYPNPSNGLVTFEYNIDGNPLPDEAIEIKILNVLGETVSELRATGKTGKINWDPQRLPSGIYMYHAINGKGIIGTGKLVLRK